MPEAGEVYIVFLTADCYNKGQEKLCAHISKSVFITAYGTGGAYEQKGKRTGRQPSGRGGTEQEGAG